MATYLEQSLVKLKEFEGCVPWMYRDTVGRVTAGIGVMLPDAAAAIQLPFTVGGRAATAEEVARDFARVAAMEAGKAAAFYRCAASPELASSTIDESLRTLLIGFEAKLRAVLKRYDSFPDGVKLALLDMVYNLGPAGLLEGYPRLIAAVEEEHWAQAASECVRHGPSAARNLWTREQFLSAVVAKIQAEAESLLGRLWQRMLGLFRRWFR